MSAGNQRGMALVVVLLVMALMVAMVVEFARNVQLGSDQLGNWKTMQKLSLAADSGVSVAARVLQYYNNSNTDVSIFLPPYEVFGQAVYVSLEVEDVTSRFKLDRLYNDDIDGRQYKSWTRLIEALELEEEVAARIADWIDPDTDERWPGAELESPNKALASVEELLQVPGITLKIYAKLKSYVTVHGSGMVNVNLAEAPVLHTLSLEMSDSMSEQIEVGRKEGGRYPDEAALEAAAPGFSSLTRIAGYTFAGNTYSVVSTATDDQGLTRIIECVITSDGTVQYWKEH